MYRFPRRIAGRGSIHPKEADFTYFCWGIFQPFGAGLGYRHSCNGQAGRAELLRQTCLLPANIQFVLRRVSSWRTTSWALWFWYSLVYLRFNSFAHYLRRYQLAQGKKGTVVGWGLTENGTLSSSLRMTELPVVSASECTDSHPDFFGSQTRSTTFCAGYRNGTKYELTRLTDRGNERRMLISLILTVFAMATLAVGFTSVQPCKELRGGTFKGWSRTVYPKKVQRDLTENVRVRTTQYLQELAGMVIGSSGLCLESIWSRNS